LDGGLGYPRQLRQLLLIDPEQRTSSPHLGGRYQC
jgi:hypothetical protein